MPGDGTEAVILDAAHRVFLRRGTAGARTQEIADEAGVNKALLHYYFRTKDRLADAVFQRAVRQLLPGLFAILASDEPLDAKVERAVAYEMAFFERNPYLPGYVLGELAQRPERVRELVLEALPLPIAELRARMFGRLGEQLEAGARAGTVRRMPPEQFVVNLIALCHFPFAARPMLEVFLGEDGFETFLRERTADLTRYILHAIRP
jgi:AcrR family transcriptional regulator